MFVRSRRVEKSDSGHREPPRIWGVQGRCFDRCSCPLRSTKVVNYQPPALTGCNPSSRAGFKRCGGSKCPTIGQDKAGQIMVEACSALRDIFAIQVRDVQYDLGSAWAVGSGKGSPLDALAFTLYEIQALMKLQQFPALDDVQLDNQTTVVSLGKIVSLGSSGMTSSAFSRGDATEDKVNMKQIANKLLY
ncbi:hypothetical protein PCH_Pc18g01800 [Penicillium rubens Wisconsin 54-1255]|uniref:Uncharacterized protein n=1 Tax=Penicillium rubens (strain ATCC 28089 / DSM 1075 / NRRL 1951 / Wisconsin 54-1255) TaxID=500485 RepID=B6HCK1_PENRW|nr:hypothetical protein PCH_Pc18g01800 [Penicillium rubens Wisconsin 54-1255]